MEPVDYPVTGESVEGDAVTLVLVPGLLCDRTIWRPFLRQFDARLRTHIPKLITQKTLSQMAADTLAACPGELYVAGHSMGARVALEMIRQSPQRITKLALLDTGSHPFVPGEEIRRNALIELAYTHGMRALAERWLLPMVHPSRANDAQLMRQLVTMVEKMTPEIHENQIHALLNRPDATPVLSAINCPTLVLVGREDSWSPVDQHEQISQRVSGSRLVVIENAGHFTVLEQPGDVNYALDSWLNESPLR